MADAHDPRPARCLAELGLPVALRLRLPAQDHVSAGVDRVVARAGRLQDERRLLDRPALDVARRIEAAEEARAANVEEAVAFPAERLTAGQDKPDVGRAIVGCELTPGQAADLAAGPVRTEPGINV